MAALFGADELTGWLGKPVGPERAATVEKVVWGWIKPILGVDERPDVIPSEWFSWAIELGGIGHENPAGLTAKQIGPFNEQYSAERRKEILTEISNTVAGGGSVAVFPDAVSYPDPARGPSCT